eukprot:TRINITY_DN67726_c4_g1_i1.p1 TRINITY_DN67726_c4_g1~~TRINITY_DN67726_c4_g1_i1.p1  ORF type:complete len:373 (+),score=215.53 TRINITY_DN67726_c4_g1_i1:76-1194(+)
MHSSKRSSAASAATAMANRRAASLFNAAAASATGTSSGSSSSNRGASGALEDEMVSTVIRPDLVTDVQQSMDSLTSSVTNTAASWATLYRPAEKSNTALPGHTSFNADTGILAQLSGAGRASLFNTRSGLRSALTVIGQSVEHARAVLEQLAENLQRLEDHIETADSSGANSMRVRQTTIGARLTTLQDVMRHVRVKLSPDVSPEDRLSSTQHLVQLKRGQHGKAIAKWVHPSCSFWRAIEGNDRDLRMYTVELLRLRIKQYQEAVARGKAHSVRLSESYTLPNRSTFGDPPFNVSNYRRRKRKFSDSQQAMSEATDDEDDEDDVAMPDDDGATAAVVVMSSIGRSKRGRSPAATAASTSSSSQRRSRQRRK